MNQQATPATSAHQPTAEELKQPNDEQPKINDEKRVKALILTGFGINCEEEVAAAYELAGAAATIVHLNQVLHGYVSIHDYDTLNFPGGFSFGDDLGSGVVLANKLRYRRNAEGRTLLDDIREFVANGKFVLGICNGFQVLVKLGLLPNLSGLVRPEVTLTHNASGRYEDRWVRLKVNPNSNSPFLKGLDTLEVPVRHGEGRLIISGPATLAHIEAQALNCLTYADFNGSPTDVYPYNPNGADLNCAGLTDPTGQVFGLMPHPEAFLSLYNHPDWARRKRANPGLSEEGDGLRLFRNIVAHVAALHGGPRSPAPSPVGRGSQPTSQHSSNKETQDVLQHVPRPTGEGPGVGLPTETSIVENVFTTTPQKWKVLKEYGRDMRKQPTPAEEVLWEELRGQKLAVKFRRQHAIDSYIVDFITIPDKLIVEVDGEIHAEPSEAEYDAGRTHALEALGYKMLRFSNAEVLNHMDKVLAAISDHLTQTNQTKRLRTNP
ncbi:MAG: phosphoribosylformylglycinamidine synthase subunit PurQ [Hymenobacter sp.]|nr:phosphoribosylformylglycinamidine synthase subunit PurQ [Hymenobacter sp.]